MFNDARFGRMYILNHAGVTKIFGEPGYPIYIIYPLANTKVLGVLTILTKFSKILKDWA